MMSKITKPQYEVLCALLPPERRIVHRPHKLSPIARKISLTGANVVEMVGHRERFIGRVQGKAVSSLIKNGFLVEIGKRPAHGTLYDLTKEAREAFAKFKEGIDAGTQPTKWDKPPVRVTLRHLQAMAAEHGCTVKKNIPRSWFELERLDGKQLAQPALSKPDSRRGCRLLTEMTLSEWKDAIERSAILYEGNNRDAKEPRKPVRKKEPKDPDVHSQPAIRCGTAPQGVTEPE